MDEEQKDASLVHPDVKCKIEALTRAKGITHYSIHISPGTIKGDNYLGVIAKVKIEGIDREGREVVFNWIVKSAPQMELLRKIIKVDMVYVREVYVYEKLFPYFDEFLAEKCVIEPFADVPIFVTSYMEMYKESLIMVDMKNLGFVMKDRKRPLDYNHVRLVMKAYGKLHAISYALKDQRPEDFKRMASETEDRNFFDADKDEIAKGYATYNKRAIENFDPVKDAHIITKFKKYTDNAFEIVLSTIKLSSESPHSVIGHGDSWVNNMLFKYDNEKHPDVPTNVCLLDWQLCRYGSPAFDLTYFIFTCTDKELRDEHYDDMINIYYHTLCSYLAELGSSPEKLLPYAALQAELKRFSILGLSISVMVLYLMLSEVDEIPDWANSENSEEMMNSMCYTSKNDDRYRKRIGGVISDYVEKGYLDFLE